MELCVMTCWQETSWLPSASSPLWYGGLRAYSGKVDTGFPQKMRPNKESRARFRFNLVGMRSNESGPQR